jgi:ribonuclease T1
LRFQGKPLIWTGLALSGSDLWLALRKWGVTVAVASSLAVGCAAGARTTEPAALLPAVALASLPAEAQAMHRLILSGGPFPYAKDGIVFGNRERLLPPKPRGQYREYTVKTPGAGDRGARRIVCAAQPPLPPSACYYTGDHYASFSRIRP